VDPVLNAPVYGALHDEMICDRIVLGLLDANLSMKPQMDTELTLNKEVTLARQSEAIKQQQKVVKGGVGSNPPSVGAITRQQPHQGDRPKRQTHLKPTLPQATCTRCGRSQHTHASNAQLVRLYATNVPRDDTFSLY